MSFTTYLLYNIFIRYLIKNDNLNCLIHECFAFQEEIKKSDNFIPSSDRFLDP